MGRPLSASATAAAAVVTLVACLSTTTTTTTSAFVLRPSSSTPQPSAAAASSLVRPRGVCALSAVGGGNAGGESGNNKDDLYYQRFMGMNEGEPTDDVRVAAEIADMDPSTIDSLRRGSVMDDKVKMPASSSSSSSSFSSSSSSIGGSIGSSASGFLDSMKKKAPSFSPLGGGGGGSSSGGISGNSGFGGGSTTDMMMSGPKVYIIPQNQGEAPLEIKSVAPGQKRSQKGVIAEIPGRSFPKRPRRVDLGEKMAEVKRTIQEAPTRLTELQVQNLRNGAAINPTNQGNTNTNNNNQNNSANQNNNINQMAFPSFPAQQPMQQQQQQPQKQQQSLFAGLGAGRGSSSRSSKRRGSMGQPDGGRRRRGGESASQLSGLARDWRVWVGGIAAISFFMALVNSLSYRGELVVMDSSSSRKAATSFMVEGRDLVGAGQELDRLFV